MQEKEAPAFMAIGLRQYNTADIIRMEASSNYTLIWTVNRRKLVSAKVLKSYEKYLAAYGFIRTHRTHLVNRRHINCIWPDGRIEMSDTSMVALSRRQKKKVIHQLTQAA
jgi:two-component system, LytTR family, response regulator